jgi:hypothetical protein
MKTKLFKAICVAVLLSLLIAPVAFAAPVKRHVHCEGSGYAYMRGDVTVDVSARYGTLTFHDAGGDGVLRLSGSGRKVVRGAWTYVYGFNGQAHADGSQIGMTISGRNVVLDVTGQGVLHVRGIGFCTIDGARVNWSNAMQELSVGE